MKGPTERGKSESKTSPEANLLCRNSGSKNRERRPTEENDIAQRARSEDCACPCQESVLRFCSSAEMCLKLEGTGYQLLSCRIY